MRADRQVKKKKVWTRAKKFLQGGNVKCGDLTPILLTPILIISFILTSGFCLAGEGDLDELPDPEKARLEAEEMLKEYPALEELPVEESANDGYWWMKQDYATKLNYVENLIIAFGVDIKLTIKEVVSRLDVFYHPIDDPIDIKMDKSLERAFSMIIREERK